MQRRKQAIPDDILDALGNSNDELLKFIGITSDVEEYELNFTQSDEILKIDDEELVQEEEAPFKRKERPSKGRKLDTVRERKRESSKASAAFKRLHSSEEDQIPSDVSRYMHALKTVESMEFDLIPKAELLERLRCKCFEWSKLKKEINLADILDQLCKDTECKDETRWKEGEDREPEKWEWHHLPRRFIPVSQSAKEKEEIGELQKRKTKVTEKKKIHPERKKSVDVDEIVKVSPVRIRSKKKLLAKKIMETELKIISGEEGGDEEVGDEEGGYEEGGYEEGGDEEGEDEEGGDEEGGDEEEEGEKKLEIYVLPSKTTGAHTYKKKHKLVTIAAEVHIPKEKHELLTKAAKVHIPKEKEKLLRKYAKVHIRKRKHKLLTKDAEVHIPKEKHLLLPSEYTKADHMPVEQFKLKSREQLKDAKVLHIPTGRYKSGESLRRKPFSSLIIPKHGKSLPTMPPKDAGILHYPQEEHEEVKEIYRRVLKRHTTKDLTSTAAIIRHEKTRSRIASKDAGRSPKEAGRYPKEEVDTRVPDKRLTKRLAEVRDSILVKKGTLEEHEEKEEPSLIPSYEYSSETTNVQGLQSYEKIGKRKIHPSMFHTYLNEFNTIKEFAFVFVDDLLAEASQKVNVSIIDPLHDDLDAIKSELEGEEIEGEDRGSEYAEITASIYSNVFGNDLTSQEGRDMVANIIKKWNMKKHWKHCIDFRGEKKDSCSDFYVYEVSFVFETERYTFTPMDNIQHELFLENIIDCKTEFFKKIRF